ncbi:MAG: PD-(D/E)XK nuclease family protein [Candidatus Woesebacteria bacterium]|nr:PD-(D/E)XK nuclease family protein [Candidatus Woesebacteria bacterium]
MATTKLPMFPHTFDSTMLGAFRSCPQKMFRTYVEHWKPKSESVHLVAGGAFARGIEVARKAFYEQGASEEDAIATGLHALLIAYGDFETPADSAKSATRMAGALEFYFENYPLAEASAVPVAFPNGKLAIEFSFAEPLDILHPVTGDPILYTGRADMIAEFCGGQYCVDEKTTSSLGASWGKQWEMRSQFTGYQWAANKAGMNVQGTLVRGVSILKTKYDHLQHVTYRTPYEVDRWLAQVHRDIERAIEMWKDDYWDYSLDHACAEYGGCSMVNVCKSSEPASWLPMYFDKRVWDPLARQERTVEEWEASWGHTTS